NGACIDFYLSTVISEKTHVVTRLTFQRNRQAGSFKYWTWSIADKIETGVTPPTPPSTNFLRNGGPNNCNCIDPIDWSMGKSKSNRIILTCRGNTPSLYRIDKSNVLQSYFKIVKNGYTWDEYITKPIGYCNPL
ncbi:MAG: hypothetical protein WBP41_13680, partial [Saprospiraceae bacterium]